MDSDHRPPYPFALSSGRVAGHLGGRGAVNSLRSIAPALSALVLVSASVADAEPAGAARPPEAPLADLSVRVSGAAEAVRVGWPLTAAIAVENSGPLAATDVRLTVVPPPAARFPTVGASPRPCRAGEGGWTCDLEDLPAGQGRAVTFTAWATEAGTLDIVATVTASTTDPEPSGDVAVASVTAVGKGCTAIGTPGHDVLEGSARADVLCGLGGNDLLAGGEGADTLVGGPGVDTTSHASAPAGVAVDLASGTSRGEGRDRLLGVEGAIGSVHGDALLGDGGPNALSGGGGSDRLVGVAGADRLLGGPGADYLRGGAGADSVAGGPGPDTCLREGADTEASCEAGRLQAFARAAGLPLRLPSRDPVAVTFHQSLFRSAAALRPLGRPLWNANPEGLRPPPATEGPAYIVMASRGRGTPATSAADIVVPAGSPVLSPVDGRVVGARNYLLYCRYPDAGVVIRPAARPDLRVVVFHLTGLQVRPGDPVFDSFSAIGYPRSFPFPSQANVYVPGHHPHVHVELQRAVPIPLPGC